MAKIERLPVGELEARRVAAAADGGPRQVLDVREQRAGAAGHIPGAGHMPYHDIDAVPAGIDPALPVAVVCASGQRAAVAASLLARYGAREVLHVVGGGVGTWARAGGALELASA